MKWNDHSGLRGLHAILGGSQYHWINYDEDKMARVYKNMLAKDRGTILHDFASQCINLNQPLPDVEKTLNMFVNDALGFRMKSEQVLYYSENCFGTADAISFINKVLRISDLKTGSTPAHMEQLMVYAALFCLEYKQKPGNIKMEFRIYQSNKIIFYEPSAEEILPIMDKIKQFDKLIESLKESEV